MFRDLIKIKEGESILVRYYDLQHVILLNVHSSDKLKLEPVMCKRYVINGCPFCNEFDSSIENWRYELQRKTHVLYNFGDVRDMELRLLYVYDVNNARELMKSLRKYETQFKSGLMKLTYSKGSYTIKPIIYMSKQKKSLFDEMSKLVYSTEWVCDCTPYNTREELLKMLGESKLLMSKP